MPDTLRPAFVAQAEVLHDLLFAQAFAALQTVARRKNVLGAEIAAVKKLTDRAQVLEGNLHVESTPGAGTTLRLSVKRTTLMAPKKTSHE